MYRLGNLKTQYIIYKMSKYISAKYGEIKFVNGLDSDITGKNFNIINAYINSNWTDTIAGGTGASISKYRALKSALGESLERNVINSNLLSKCSPLCKISFNELIKKNIDALSPRECALYADYQYDIKDFKFKKFNEDLKIDWISSKNLNKNKECYIPINYLLEHFGENKICHSTSSGLACGDTKEDSILKGLYEVIERDAFCFSWWTRTSFPLIDMNSIKYLKVEGVSIEKYLGEHFKHIKLIDMTTDIGVPVISAIYHCDDCTEKPAFLISAACNLNPIKAIEKALIEILHCYYGSNSYLEDNSIQNVEDYDKEILTFDDHVKYYISHKNKEKVEFLYKHNNTITFNELINKYNYEIDNELDYITNRLNQLNYNIYTIDITPDIYLPNNLYVFKTIVPGLIQLDGAHKYRFLGSERLYNLKKKLGFVDYDLDVKELNNNPHPFP